MGKSKSYNLGLSNAIGVHTATANLEPGDNTIASGAFNSTIPKAPFMVIVLDSGNAPLEISWSSSPNGNTYDLTIYSTESQTNVKIVALC